MKPLWIFSFNNPNWSYLQLFLRQCSSVLHQHVSVLTESFRELLLLWVNREGAQLRKEKSPPLVLGVLCDGNWLWKRWVGPDDCWPWRAHGCSLSDKRVGGGGKILEGCGEEGTFNICFAAACCSYIMAVKLESGSDSPLSGAGEHRDVRDGAD